MVKAQTVINLIEKLAPKDLAEDWDNVGLQIGNPQSEVNKILVCLDLTEQILDQAVELDVEMIITHHPLIFKPLKKISLATPLGKKINKIIKNDLLVYSAHTNLDIAWGGINDILVEKLGLLQPQVLAATGEENFYKLVVFVPAGHEESLKEALASSGAGWIGNYSHCFFQTSGTGNFKPLEGTNPFLGSIGKVETTEEYRLETIIPEKCLKRALQSMLKAHPYEEVAYDLYLLANEGKKVGLGRVGYLPEPLTLAEFVSQVKNSLGVKQLRVVGDLDNQIRKVAVCGGSGGSLVSAAAFKGAQVLLTGDVKYHEARDAEDLALNVVDAGHDLTEQVIIPVLVEYLLQELKEKITVIGLGANAEPIFRVV